MLRNRGARLLGIQCALIGVLATAAAWFCAGRQTALWVFGCCVVLSIIYCLNTLLRYRAIARLSERVDQALQEGRTLSFSDMSEGELAILSSEIEKALSKLVSTNEALSAEKRALSDSLADISHQLRTPLTSLGVELELIRMNTGNEEQRTRVQDSQRLVERIQWLVSALLKLARLDAGTVKLTRQTVSVKDLIDAAMTPLAISFDLADVQGVYDIDESITFQGDAAWSREALQNILKNCMEHTPPKGSVTISAQEDALATRICVYDSGTGVTEEDLPHIFDRFYRGQSSASSEVEPTGVGIGLSLAKALICAQGGTIRAKNRVDASGAVVGAQFDITFFKVTV